MLEAIARIIEKTLCTCVDLIAPPKVETTAVARERFTPEERQCFFNDEIKMVNCNSDVGCRYEFTNCLFEAYTDMVT